MSKTQKKKVVKGKKTLEDDTKLYAVSEKDLDNAERQIFGIVEEQAREILYWGATFGAFAVQLLQNEEAFSFKEKDLSKRIDRMMGKLAEDTKKMSLEDMKNFLSMSQVEWGMYCLGDEVETPKDEQEEKKKTRKKQVK